MFEQGNLVRKITDKGDAPMMSVIEDSSNDGTTFCRSLEDDGTNLETWYSSDDLELVTDDQQTSTSVEQVPNISDRTHQDIHEDITKMFVQIAQYLEANVENMGNCNISINTRYYGESEMDIEFDVSVNSNATISSSNLFTSARVAMERHNENLGLKVLRIPMYKEKAA
jgi:hypothetical protein